MSPRLAIVVPCYNEEAVLPETIRQLGALLNELKNNNQVSLDSLLLFVDDGSSDRTWEIIQEEHRKNEPSVWGMKLARNSGHQNALLAFIEAAAASSDTAAFLHASPPEYPGPDQG